MKLRNRKTRPLNLSESLAQSNWAGELHKSPVVRRTPAAALKAGEAEDASFKDAAFVTQPSGQAGDDEAGALPQTALADRAPLDPATLPAAKFTPQRVKPTRSRRGDPATPKDDQARSAARKTSRARARSKADETLGSARYAYLAAVLAGVVWAGSFIAFVFGYQHKVQPLTYAPFQAVVLAMLTVLPMAFMLLAAFAIRQGAGLAWETRNARKLAEDLVQPAALAAGQTCDLVGLVRQEVERAAEASRAASDQLASLRQGLSHETERLTEASVEAQRMARVVGETLTRERDGVAAINAALHEGALEIGEAVRRQTRLVADASDLARSQLNEAEATLVARAADLAHTTSIAETAARDATDQLARHTERLDVTAAALVERARHLDARLAEQRSGLTALLESCNFDQDDIAARLETRRAQLIEVIAQSRLEASEIGQASSEGAGALRELIGEASEQMRELVLTAETEHAHLSQRAAAMRAEVEADLHKGVAAFDAAAKAAYGELGAQADQSRQAAGAYVEAAKAKVEQLGELSFEAGQRAGKAFDARLDEARRLIEDSVAMIEAAGSKSAEQIVAGLAATRAALADLGGALAEIDAKTAALPHDVEARVQVLRLAVDKGVGELTASAQRVADETRFIDDAFQARVKRNYDTLSEATRMMSRAPIAEESIAAAKAAPGEAVAKPSGAPIPAAEPSPRGKAFDFGALERRIPTFTPSATPRFANGAYKNGGPEPEAVSPPKTEPVAERAAASTQSSVAPQTIVAPPEPDMLRPRLRLTPTDSDTALRTVFDPLQPREAQPSERPPSTARTQGERPAARADAEMDEWSWTDLLSSLDDKPAGGDDGLAEQMIGEIAALGVDAGALLPQGRVEEIAASLQAGDVSAARDSVRRVAPAAIRRLSRRVLTDTALREQADRYVRRYHLLLRGSSERSEEATSTLLSSDPGRAYLLLDAAVGDLQ